MISIKFYKEELFHYTYRYNQSDDFNVWVLFYFLDDLVSKNSYSLLLSELNDKNSKGLTGNASDLTLYNEKAIISSLYDDEKRTLVIDRSHLFDLVKKWRALCKEGVPAIIIKREGNKFSIEATNNNQEA